MRIIKFRGKRLGDNQWVYGSLISDKEKGVGIMQQRENPMHDGVVQGWCHGIHPETVGQFTGLQSKDGRDIYEGDILLEGSYKFTVQYDIKWAKFKLVHEENTIQYPEWNRGIQMEIIGNIHENKGGGDGLV